MSYIFGFVPKTSRQAFCLLYTVELKPSWIRFCLSVCLFVCLFEAFMNSLLNYFMMACSLSKDWSQICVFNLERMSCEVPSIFFPKSCIYGPYQTKWLNLSSYLQENYWQSYLNSHFWGQWGCPKEVDGSKIGSFGLKCHRNSWTTQIIKQYWELWVINVTYLYSFLPWIVSSL